MNHPVSLKALAEGKADGIQKATSFKVHPSTIRFEPGFNLREEGPDLDAHIERLYLAMKAGAYIPPIDVSVVEGEIIARDGHCRTRAALRLVQEVPEYRLEARQVRGSEADNVLHMLGTGSGQLALSLLQQGRGFARLVNYGMTVADIAARLGLSRSTIDNGLAAVDMPVAVQMLVGAGEVGSHLALKTVRKHGAKVATEKLVEAVAVAKAAGKKKATAKHVTVPKVVTPPSDIADEAIVILRKLAEVNLLITNLDRIAVGDLVQEARMLMLKISVA